MLSNKLIDPAKSQIDAKNLPETMQEAVTAMLSVNRSYLNYVIEHIINKYGSVDAYLEKELRVSSGKRNLLRKYLLYSFWFFVYFTTYQIYFHNFAAVLKMGVLKVAI